MLGSRPYSSHFTRGRLATVLPMRSVDTSSQISHICFGACWVFDANHSGTMLWTGTGIHLGNPYSCRVVCVDCPLSSDKKIAKRKIIWIPLMAQEGGTLYTDGAKGFELKLPLTAMMWLVVKCHGRMFPACFFSILKVKVRAVMPHIRGKFCYTSSFLKAWGLWPKTHWHDGLG